MEIHLIGILRQKDYNKSGKDFVSKTGVFKTFLRVSDCFKKLRLLFITQAFFILTIALQSILKDKSKPSEVGFLFSKQAKILFQFTSP